MIQQFLIDLLGEDLAIIILIIIILNFAMASIYFWNFIIGRHIK